MDEALYEDKLSVVFDDLAAARETLDRVRAFVRNHPTVYCGTHTPQGYENLEAKRVMDLEHPVETVFAEVDFTEQEASGKYVCSICGYVYDPAEHDGIEVTVRGDSAEMTGRSRVLAAVYGGAKRSWRLRGDFTLRKENGVWKFTGSEASTY